MNENLSYNDRIVLVRSEVASWNYNDILKEIRVGHSDDSFAIIHNLNAVRQKLTKLLNLVKFFEYRGLGRVANSVNKKQARLDAKMAKAIAKHEEREIKRYEKLKRYIKRCKEKKFLLEKKLGEKVDKALP